MQSSNQISSFPDLSCADGAKPSTWKSSLEHFASINNGAFIFTSVSPQEREQFTSKLLNIIHDLIQLPGDQESIAVCLSALAIMSRDAHSINKQFNCRRTWLDLCLLAGLNVTNHEDGVSKTFNFKEDIVMLCLKCLSNLIYITKDSNRYCSDTNFLESVINQLATLTAVDTTSTNLEFLFVRLVFLVTALNDGARLDVVNQYNGRKILIDSLSRKLLQCRETGPKIPTSRAVLSQNLSKSCSEIFKTLFNMNMKCDDLNLPESVVNDFDSIVSLCRKFLLIIVENDEGGTEKLHVDVQNCLYSVVSSHFDDEAFIPPLPNDKMEVLFSYDGADLPTFEDRDVSSVLVILRQLQRKVHADDTSTQYLVPVLSLLSVLSRTSRIVRKYCKTFVIPPRKDFKNRPEMGSKFRNKLIKLFTDHNTEIKGAAADFIFVLCKENVDRLIKYTGYGNAAGLLASRGLLAGGKGSKAYSDTDTDSDTEEYRENIDKINPVTGHIPPVLPNPVESMSDEQKEYMAVQLATQISKLSSNEVIQPVCVDPNTGKLVSFQQKVHETVLPEEKDSDDSD